MYLCVHHYTLVIKYHQLTLQPNNRKDLWLHSHKKKQKNKQANKQKPKSIHCDGWWNLFSSAGEREEK